MGGLTKSLLSFRNVRDLGGVMPTINCISDLHLKEIFVKSAWDFLGEKKHVFS